MTDIDPAAQMGDFPCPLCGSLEIWIEGWPTCACDDGPPGRTLSVREAAPYLCKSPSGVYHLINDGELPVVRNSRPLRIRLIALKCYRAADHAYWRYYAIQERREREIGT